MDTVTRGVIKGGNEHSVMVGAKSDRRNDPSHTGESENIEEAHPEPADLDVYVASAQRAEVFYGAAACRVYAGIANTVTAVAPRTAALLRKLNKGAEVEARMKSRIRDRPSLHESTSGMFTYAMWRNRQATEWHVDESDVGMATCCTFKCAP